MLRPAWFLAALSSLWLSSPGHALDLCNEGGNRAVKTPQADGTCRRGTLVTVVEEDVLPPAQREIVTFTFVDRRDDPQATYTVPDERDFLITDFCATDGSMALKLGNLSIMSVNLNAQCHALTTDSLVSAGETLGCEGGLGTCTFSGILMEPR